MLKEDFLEITDLKEISDDEYRNLLACFLLFVDDVDETQYLKNNLD